MADQERSAFRPRWGEIGAGGPDVEIVKAEVLDRDVGRVWPVDKNGRDLIGEAAAVRGVLDVTVGQRGGSIGSADHVLAAPPSITILFFELRLIAPVADGQDRGFHRGARIEEEGDGISRSAASLNRQSGADDDHRRDALIAAAAGHAGGDSRRRPRLQPWRWPSRRFRHPEDFHGGAAEVSGPSAKKTDIDNPPRPTTVATAVAPEPLRGDSTLQLHDISGADPALGRR